MGSSSSPGSDARPQMTLAHRVESPWIHGEDNIDNQGHRPAGSRTSRRTHAASPMRRMPTLNALTNARAGEAVRSHARYLSCLLFVPAAGRSWLGQLPARRFPSPCDPPVLLRKTSGGVHARGASQPWAPHGGRQPRGGETSCPASERWSRQPGGGPQQVCGAELYVVDVGVLSPPTLSAPPRQFPG